jgi:hypothetical protein
VDDYTELGLDNFLNIYDWCFYTWLILNLVFQVTYEQIMSLV